MEMQLNVIECSATADGPTGLYAFLLLAPSARTRIVGAVLNSCQKCEPMKDLQEDAE